MFLGNLDAKRDWGHAKDFVEGMWLILQQAQPEDYVLATGITTKIRDFVSMTFQKIGIRLRFEGEGKEEVAVVEKCEGAYQVEKGKVVVKVDPRYFRPTEVDLLIGDPSKAKEKLGWRPKYDLDGLIEDMITADIKLFERDQFLLKSGHQVRNFHE